MRPHNKTPNNRPHQLLRQQQLTKHSPQQTPQPHHHVPLSKQPQDHKQLSTDHK